MVVGNGLISNSFKDFINNKDYLIFASGVSNSNEENDSEYEREFSFIKENLNKSGKFIYFSTINNKENKYFKHKRKMEEYIITNSTNYLIFRLPNVVGNGGNINNIFNFLNNKIKNNELIKVKNVNRSLIDIDDVKNICLKCLNIKNKVLNISNIENIKVIDIINMMSFELNKDPILELDIDYKENNSIIENSLEIENSIKELNIIKKNYIKTLIKKYIKK